MKKMKIEKGITLISLVVTIIILIILAGISINLLFGDTGIITKAKNAKKEQDIVRIGEKLELEKAELAVKEYGKLDVNKYLDQIKTKYYKNYTFNLCTLNGRKYYKTSSEGTINAIAYYINNGHWTNVLTIGNTESSVSNTCDYDNKVHNKWTINYNGTIYYCSNEHALTNPRSISSNIAILNSYNNEYSSLDAVYRALLDRYYQ